MRAIPLPLDPERSNGLAEAVDAALTPLFLLASQASAAARPRVSSSQLQALLALEHHGALNLTGLADVLRVIPSSATRLCDRLVAAGLITRSTGEADRREVVLTLTGSGSRLVRHVRALRREALGSALSQLTDRERRSLVSGLGALAAQLQQQPQTRPASAAEG